MVPPGEHEYHTEVTPQLELPYDTYIHYATGHLHPFAESLKLVDMDSGETLLEINSSDFNDKFAVEHMSEFSSKDGIMVRKDGRYELIAKYHNTGSHPVDAMAILYFYASELGLDLVAS